MRVMKELKMDYVTQPETDQDDELQTIRQADSESLKAVGMKDKHQRKCYIYIFRDPRDVALSACHYFLEEDACNADKYLSERISGYTAWTQVRYDEYKTVSEVAPEQNFAVFFSDLKLNFVPTIQRLAESFGMPITDAQAAAVEKAVSFSEMRKAEQRNRTLLDKSVLSRGGKNDKMRKGTHCGFKGEVTEKTAEAVTTKMNSLLSKELAEMFDCEK
jgi:hypothetical protein